MKTANINTLQSFCMNLKKYCISEADDEKFVYCFRGHKSTDFKYIPSILREGVTFDINFGGIYGKM